MNKKLLPGRLLRRALKTLAWGLLILAAVFGIGWWYFHPSVTVQPDVGYSVRNGTRLSYDAVIPARQNGAAVLLMVSGSWKSTEARFEPWPAAIFLRRGYAVFAIRHLSQPKATVAEIVEDVNRAVRHIRHHAADYGIDKERFGITGGSSGGHLSLMLATRGGPGFAVSDDTRSSVEADSINLESSAVQAVAVFFPVTDLVDLGPSTQNPGDGGPPMSFVAGFGFKGREGDRRHIAEVDLPRWKEEARDLSPIYHIGKDLPPVLIIHGSADTLVPLDQSQRFLARAGELGLGDRIDLQIRKNKKHGWPTMIFELRHFADWFDQHLAPRS